MLLRSQNVAKCILYFKILNGHCELSKKEYSEKWDKKLQKQQNICRMVGRAIEVTSTVRPRGTWPRGTQTSLGHDYKKGSKILAGHDFGTWTSRDTILKSAQKLILHDFSQNFL